MNYKFILYFRVFKFDYIKLDRIIYKINSTIKL